MAGAIVTVDGATSRPAYSESPPEEFYDVADPASPLSGPDVFRAADFGAVGDPAVDNRAAIQDATAADIHDNGTYGVGIYGSGSVSMIDNTVHDISRSGEGSFAGVQIREGGDLAVTGGVYSANDTMVCGNNIDCTCSSRWGCRRHNVHVNLRSKPEIARPFGDYFAKING